MGVFDEILTDGESLFLNDVALDYDFMPKLVPFRENQQQHIAFCIKPLFQKRNGSNALVFGVPGIGKTVATKKLLDELEEQTDEIIPVYVNCWQHNSTYKIIVEMCSILGYKFIQNKNTNELIKLLIQMLNKNQGSSVLVFDEIDKVDGLDFLYTILEQVYRKSIILITNYKKDIVSMDARIKSRLNLESIEFKPYNFEEVAEILKQRRDIAFVKDIWDKDAFQLVVGKCSDLEDVRKGLYLMKESGNIAEQHSSRKIIIEYVKKAIEKLESFQAKDLERLGEDEQILLELIKEKKELKIGDLFEEYTKKGGNSSYKTVQRKIEKLSKNKLIAIEKTAGESGNTRIISPKKEKKLDEF